jgi:CheY-like chemotaxis protein/anti-sigma regulatory factor (Ser/Thr protein kinase)
MTRILVIEDDQDIRNDVLELLEAEGHTIRGAEDGLAGVATARTDLPGLIICDIMMPGLDGFGVLDELRHDPVTATIPFVFLTAKVDKSDLRRGMELGADDYLTKPFTRAELLKAIQVRLAKQAALDKEFQAKLQELRNSMTLSLPHELRTPLTGILTGSAMLLEQDMLKPSDIRELAGIIHSSAKRLNRLVMNYLLYAEIETTLSDQANVQALRQVHTQVARTVVESVAMQTARAAERQDDLKLELETVTLSIGQLHLEKMVEELLDNAFKYSKAGTPVSISGVRGPSSYALSITDHGRGLTARQIANIGAFIQFDRKLHEQQGPGLGLVIVKRLAELYRGQMDIDSL